MSKSSTFQLSSRKNPNRHIAAAIHASTRVLLLIFALILAAPPAGYSQNRPGTNPPVELAASSGGRIWVYLPANVAPGAKIPCVLVPPAGGKLFIGMKLSDGDREEHWPYAQAGFAVISFDISGVWEDQNSEASMKKALVGYMNARCGINDASEALRVTLAKYPQIDARRLYVAGHSSAGTLALQIAAAAPEQIKGCAAFAPLTDVEKHLAEGLPTMDRFVPGFGRVIRENSPANRMDAIRCPVFLFHALDDKGITPQMITGYRDALIARGKKVDYAVVPTGGHYDSMIQQGIPKAVVWFKALDQAQPK